MNNKEIKKLESSLGLLRLVLFGLLAAIFITGIGGLGFLDKPKKKIQVVVLKKESVKSDDVFGDDVKNGIHIPTGFIAKGDYGLVIQNCVACHSSKLVTQNRMDAKTWRKTIKWMQKTQNLWDLGINEDKIVAYLGKYYAPKNMGRRKALVVEEWYEL